MKIIKEILRRLSGIEITPSAITSYDIPIYLQSVWGDINTHMGYRKIDQVLCYDGLKPGQDPTYDVDNSQDICYLGLAGELANDVKCHKITLPMLDKEKYNWKEILPKALAEAISLRPQKHVSCLKAACDDFTKKMFDKGLVEYHDQQPAIWFSNTETYSKTRYCPGVGRYPSDDHYFSDRCNIRLDLPTKTIALIPHSKNFGVLATNEQFVNFFFLPEQIMVYHLDNLCIHES